MTQEPDSGFRILSINGGGIRGAFAAAYLAETERLTGKSIIEHFDLIVGTSTGGLIAIALALGKPSDQVLQQYKVMGPRVFPKCRITWLLRQAWGFGFPRYSAKKLANSTRDLIGESALLGDALRPLVIPAFDLGSGRPVCFKTRHSADLIHDHKLPAWRVAMATSAAPTYFPPHRMPDGSAMIDGGVWANDPALIASVEAVSRLGAEWKDIRVLSIGTAGSPKIVRSPRFGGFIKWGLVHGVHEVLVQASELGDSYKNKLVLPDGAITRIDERPSKPISLAAPRKLDELVGLGLRAAEANASEVSSRFLREPAQPWAPVPE